MSADEYKVKSSKLKKSLKQLQGEQKATNERVRNWYEIMGNTLTKLENANEKFAKGDLIEKRRILSALGSNPVLTDRKLSIEEHYWLLPLKENKAELTDMLEKVRTSPQQRQNSLREAVFTLWCG